MIDPGWSSLLTTPPFPEFTSGHSVQSGAAATVLTDLFGDVAFTDHTHEERGLAPRSFETFWEAAHEAAISRLYGGIHFRPTIDSVSSRDGASVSMSTGYGSEGESTVNEFQGVHLLERRLFGRLSTGVAPLRYGTAYLARDLWVARVRIDHGRGEAIRIAHARPGAGHKIRGSRRLAASRPRSHREEGGPRDLPPTLPSVPSVGRC